jgi:hypothetical protein
MTQRKREKHKKKLDLAQRYPPSEPCSCKVCLAYCARPGWWTVVEADRAMKAGFGRRMMLEMSPDRTWGVLSPAFFGCEGSVATQDASTNGCNFLKNSLCELFGTGLQPLECRFCHHERKGLGQTCHADLEKDWHSVRGRKLVTEWLAKSNLSLLRG